jgi:hypothetical protein
MQHQVETLRQQLQKHHQDAAKVEEVLGHASSPTQRWLALKAQEVGERISELQGSFATGEITRLVDGVNRINRLYYVAGQAWVLPQVRMPSQFPEVAFAQQEEPAAAPVIRTLPAHDRNVSFSHHTDATHAPVMLASSVVNPFTVPEQPLSELAANVAAPSQPEAEPKQTIVETIANILASRPIRV